MNFQVGEKVVSTSAARKRKSRQARTQDKKTQDREAHAALVRKGRAVRAADEKTQDREIDQLERKRRRCRIVR